MHSNKDDPPNPELIQNYSSYFQDYEFSLENSTLENSI